MIETSNQNFIRLALEIISAHLNDMLIDHWILVLIPTRKFPWLKSNNESHTYIQEFKCNYRNSQNPMTIKLKIDKR
jgi:hypothetical protein